MGHVTETESKITESGYKHASTKMVPVHSVVIALAGQAFSHNPHPTQTSSFTNA